MSFADISTNDLLNLDVEKDSKSTKRTVSRSISLFRQFLGHIGEENSNFEEFSKPDLARCLRLFFASVRKGNGEELKKSSMNAVKYGLGKYLKEECGVDIEKGEEFAQCRTTYKAKLSNLQKKGKGAVEHKSEITEEDMKLLYDPNNIVFNINTPVGLQMKVWFDIMYHLCRRGQENLRSMTKMTFAVSVDSTGLEYVHQVIDEADKNHRAEASPDDTVGEGRMYARPSDPMCPVKSYKLYVSKLNPEVDALWQRPLEAYSETADIWYYKSAVGKNTLAKMMANISQVAGLSQRYTNHCIRATAIQALDRAGFEARQITRISGHKSETSIKSYSRRLTEQTKRSMSETLSKQHHSLPSTSTGPSTNEQREVAPENTSDDNDLPLDVLEQIFSDDNMFIELSNQTENNQNVSNITLNDTENNQNVSNITLNDTQNQQLNILPLAQAPEKGKQAIIYNPTFNNCVVNFNTNN